MVCVLGPLAMGLGASRLDAGSAGPLLSTAEVDLGVVEQGRPATCIVTVDGAADRSTHIGRIMVSCSTCRATLLDARGIPPGASARLRVSVTTDGEVGELSRIVRVMTDDPKRPVQSFKISATVVPFLVTKPNPVTLKDVVQGTESSLRVEIRGGTINQFEIRSCRSSVSWLEVESVVPEVEEGGSCYVVMLRLKKTAPVGQIRAVVSVDTDAPNRGPFAIPVSGRVVPAVVCDPPVLAFGQVTVGTRRVREFDFLRRGGPPLKFEQIVCDDPRISVRVTESAPDNAYHVTVELSANPPTGRLRTVLVPQGSAGEHALPTVTLFAYIVDR